MKLGRPTLVAVWAIAWPAACADETPHAPLPSEAKSARTALLYRTGLGGPVEVYDLSKRSLPASLELAEGDRPVAIFYGCGPGLLGIDERASDLTGTPCLPEQGQAFALSGEAPIGWSAIESSPAPRCADCASLWLEITGEAQIPLVGQARTVEGTWNGADSILVATYLADHNFWRVSRDGRVEPVVMEPPQQGTLLGLLVRDGVVDVLEGGAWRGRIEEGTTVRLPRTPRSLVGMPRGYVHLVELADGSGLGVDAGGFLLTETPSGWSGVQSRPAKNATGLDTLTAVDIVPFPAGSPFGTAGLVGTASTSEIALRFGNFRLQAAVLHPGGERVPVPNVESIAFAQGRPYLLDQDGRIFRVTDAKAPQLVWEPSPELSVQKLRAIGEHLLIAQARGELLLHVIESQETCEPMTYRPGSVGVPYRGFGNMEFMLAKEDQIVLVHREGRVVFGRLFDRRLACAF